MKITVLDKCTLTVGDIDFSPIEKLGNVEYYDILTKPQIISAAKDAQILLCNKAVIDGEIMDECKSLEYIGLFATGYNNIDLEAASKRGISVVNVPGYSTDSVCQLTMAYILSFATSLNEYNTSTHNGEWIRSHTFSYFPYPITELSGKTLGIYGFGAIGRRVAKCAQAFGMNVIVHTRTVRDSDYRYVTLEELFSESDFLTLHAPLTSENKELVCKKTLSLMKKTAYLINTSRGGVVNEQDLADALNNGVIAGAAIDVLTTEPMQSTTPLLKAKNCTITPHVAWASIESRIRLIKIVAENIKAYQNGTPQNAVNAK
ncbi:MAG: D-2-hydroxyacid dehydrogenase [Clostridia bacterium]|nr:D-2-hydroxyacid dehydrogenase [Clostridia bacterium]